MLRGAFAPRNFLCIYKSILHYLIMIFKNKVTLAILLVILDGITKYYAYSGKLSFDFAGIIYSKPSLNAGISLNYLSEIKYIIVIFQVVLILLAFKFLYTSYKNNIGFWLVVSGGLGNIAYRFFQEVNFMVIDFISVNNLFICNLADIYISSGVLYIVLNSLKRKSP